MKKIALIIIVTLMLTPLAYSEEAQSAGAGKVLFNIVKQYGSSLIVEQVNKKDEDTARLINFAISPTSAAISEVKSSYLKSNPGNEEQWTQLETGIGFAKDPKGAAVTFVVNEISKSDPETGKAIKLAQQIKGYYSSFKQVKGQITSKNGEVQAEVNGTTDETKVTEQGDISMKGGYESDMTQGGTKNERTHIKKINDKDTLSIKDLAAYHDKVGSTYLFDGDWSLLEFSVISLQEQDIILPNKRLENVQESVNITWKDSSLQIKNNPAIIPTTLIENSNNYKTLNFIGDGKLIQNNEAYTITASNLNYQETNFTDSVAILEKPLDGLLIQKSSGIQKAGFPEVDQVEKAHIFVTSIKENFDFTNSIYFKTSELQAAGKLQVQDYIKSFSNDTRIVIHPEEKSAILTAPYREKLVLDNVEIPLQVSKLNKLYVSRKGISNKSLDITSEESTIIFIKDPVSFIG